MNTSSNSCLIRTATTPIAPPSDSEPTSPMKISAGCALYQRKPMDAPVIAPQKTVNSDAPGRRARSRYLANSRVAADVRQHRHRPAAMIISPIARPSRPSVRFTKFEDPAITRTMNRKKNTKASGYVHGFDKQRC